MQQTRFQHLTWPLLVIILLSAATLRFYNINWDNGIFAHPDERSTVAFYAPTIRWPEDNSTILDPRASTLNPFWDVNNQNRRSYTYGHFPLYTLVLVANTLYDLAPLAGELNLPDKWVQFLSSALSGHGFARIGRGLMALVDLFTVYLLYLMGRRLYGVWGGLLAAALSAFTVLQIQLAHFFAVDTISTTFTMLAIYGAMRLYDQQNIQAASLTGLGIGLAVASKFSALPIVAAPFIAGFFVLLHWQHHGPTATNQTAEKRPTKSFVQNRIISLVLFSLTLSFLLFIITSPFVLLDFENFRHAVIEEQGNMVSGVADFPFTRQYRNTPAYWYFIQQQIQWGMGWPLGLLAVAGTVWVGGKAIRGKAHPGEWVALGWIVLYFGPTGLFLAKFMRYMLPVVPLFTLFGAGLIIAIWQFGRQKQGVSATKEGYQPNLWASSEIADNEAQTSDPLQPPLSNAPLPISPSPNLLISRLAPLLTFIVLSGTIFWSLAFVNGVYGSEHTWVTFARWTYANVPDGSCIAWEHWDDRMPSDIPEPGGNPGAHNYFQPQLPMYDNDSQQKYELIRETLSNCDYVVLATNRLWRTIPRLPERYPLSTRYYEALFSGALGFEQIYSAETPPQLGPFRFDDQPADESFTVYDHPKPILFKKVRQLTATEWDQILGNSWQNAIPGYVGQTTLMMRLRGGNDLPPAHDPGSDGAALLLDTPIDQLPPVNDFSWNTVANNSTLVAVILWWLVVFLIGLITIPLTFTLFNKLPDRGYILSRSLGLLLVSYFVWLNSSLGLLGNRASTAFIALVILLGLGIWLGLKQRQPLLDFARQQRLAIISTEIIFALVYLWFIYLRILNPDLWQPWLGGEKMLEIGFLNAIVKSANMPPYDPFFAGGIINYYYYGLFLAGVLIKLTGIQPSIAFNLAIPTLAALTAANVFSLTANLVLAKVPFALSKSKAMTKTITLQARETWNGASLGAGLLGVLFVVFIGNLEGAAQFMRNLGQLSRSEFQSAIPGLETLVLSFNGLIQLFINSNTNVATYNYWDPTRVIPETINEFPYFSFLFADLHPHMIGLPFTVLFLSLAYNWLRPNVTSAGEGNEITLSPPSPPEGGKQQDSPLWGARGADLLRWLSLPFILGAIGVINTWDLPTYLGLMATIFLLGKYRQLDGPLTWGRVGLLLLMSGLFAVALAVVTYLLYFPFFANYQAPAETGLGLVRNQTPLGQHLKIWGFFLFIVVSWLWLSLLYPASRNSILRTASLTFRHWNVWPHLSEIYSRLVRQRIEGTSWGLWGGGIGVLLPLLLVIFGYAVPAYLLPLVILTVLLLFRPEVSSAVAYLTVLAFTGLLILLGLEFFYLNDFLGGGDYYRMNTLFKFFTQVWVMLGIMTAVALSHLWYWLQHHFSLPKALSWQALLLILLMSTFIYPVFATRTRIEDRFPGDHNRPPIGTLDGLAYMSVGVFEWPAGSPIELKYDLEAIQWLQSNVSGTPIIAEAKIGYYREGGMRVAAYTGLPSILGGLHQNEQRPGSQIAERDFVINEFWTTTDPVRALQVINQFDLTYIYIGQIERITYGPQVEDKFQTLEAQGELEIVFKNEQTTIYKR